MANASWGQTMQERLFGPAVLSALMLTVAVSLSSPAAGEDGSIEETTASAEAGCPVLESANWTAWLDTLPGSPGPSLRVSGQIVLPTPGFAVTGQLAALDRRHPPSQRVALGFTPPQDVVAQVLTTQEVQLTLPALASTYRAIIITCGDTVLAEIIDVGTIK